MIFLTKEIFSQNYFNFEENLMEKSFLDYNMFFAKRTIQNKFDFYLVIEVKENNLDFLVLEENVKDFFEIIIENQHYEGIDKNLSLILLIETETDIKESHFIKAVFDFEENPYYFKKFVLTYTDNQYKLLDNFLGNKEELPKKLNGIISNKEHFSIFKKGELENIEDEYKLYDLVSKLFIKMPFLTININLETLPNLTKEIQRLIPTSYSDVVQKLLLMDEEIEWNNISKVLGVELNDI